MIVYSLLKKKQKLIKSFKEQGKCVFNYFSSILYVTFDARGVFSLMRILRGSSEVKIMLSLSVTVY